MRTLIAVSLGCALLGCSGQPAQSDSLMPSTPPPPQVAQTSDVDPLRDAVFDIVAPYPCEQDNARVEGRGYPPGVTLTLYIGTLDSLRQKNTPPARSVHLGDVTTGPDGRFLYPFMLTPQIQNLVSPEGDAFLWAVPIAAPDFQRNYTIIGLCPNDETWRRSIRPLAP